MSAGLTAKAERQVTLRFFFDRFLFRRRGNFVECTGRFVKPRHFAKAFQGGGVFGLQVDEGCTPTSRA